MVLIFPSPPFLPPFQPGPARVLLYTTGAHSPFTLTAEDSNLSLEAYDPVHHHHPHVAPAAAVSGGIAITKGWRRVALATTATSAAAAARLGAESVVVWMAPTPPHLPSARQLYVDGKRASRTKMWWPTAGVQWTVDGSRLVGTGDAAAVRSLLAFDRGRASGGGGGGGGSGVASGGNTSAAELVWTGGCKERAQHCAPGQHSYREARCPVTSIVASAGPSGGEATATVTVAVAEPCFSRAQDYSSCSTPSYINNGWPSTSARLPPPSVSPPSSTPPSLLASPPPPLSPPPPAMVVEAGDYYFDPVAAELYYAASPGWSPDASEIILPVNETLVRATAGTHNVNFTGIVFEHGGWTKPNGKF